MKTDNFYHFQGHDRDFIYTTAANVLSKKHSAIAIPEPSEM